MQNYSNSEAVSTKWRGLQRNFNRLSAHFFPPSLAIYQVSGDDYFMEYLMDSAWQKGEFCVILWSTDMDEQVTWPHILGTGKWLQNLSL